MKVSTIAKYVDQPMILNKLHKNMPAILIGAGGTFGIADYFHHKNKHGNKEEKHHLLKNMIVISSTIGASLIGTRGLKIGSKKLFNGLMENVPLKELQKTQRKAVTSYLEKTKINDEEVLKALNTAKKKELSPKQIQLLIDKLEENGNKKDLFNVILPDKKNLNSKEIFSEIGRLSLLGLVPVVGGVTGGLIADFSTHTNTKKRTANKVKEGLYQYLANIFLCNVGAGAALFFSEQLEKAGKIKPLKPTQKLFVILAGITATGIIGGSYIANYISKKCINPLFGEKKAHCSVYAERKPEPLDIALHADDIATAGILSGFKWIEPALPFMYFVSGYRAGIGYRNGHHHGHHKCKNDETKHQITISKGNKVKKENTQVFVNDNQKYNKVKLLKS